MALLDWFTQTFSIYRPDQSVDGGGAVEPALTLVGTFTGHKYSKKANEQNTIGKIEGVNHFNLLCAEDTDLTEKDQVLDSSGVYYDVKAITPRLTGDNPHLEVLIKLRV